MSIFVFCCMLNNLQAQHVSILFKNLFSSPNNNIITSNKTELHTRPTRLSQQ